MRKMNSSSFSWVYDATFYCGWIRHSPPVSRKNLTVPVLAAIVFGMARRSIYARRRNGFLKVGRYGHILHLIVHSMFMNCATVGAKGLTYNLASETDLKHGWDSKCSQLYLSIEACLSSIGHSGYRYIYDTIKYVFLLRKHIIRQRVTNVHKDLHN